jgi:hypothetical protein
MHAHPLDNRQWLVLTREVTMASASRPLHAPLVSSFSHPDQDFHHASPPHLAAWVHLLAVSQESVELTLELSPRTSASAYGNAHQAWCPE